ncbi:hypothetical protein SPBR_05119 [Sporothrix brasiliensis 5110]|uniref:Uncharacterized protein n=1 Tax=Sporothrix brasiliensis 5110 TaxID=1398154 RepID=A0A0C2EN85_9PEZI|nr:uncharacterized protein SPBR_05119 [Sporothrix brasiliensis 5110]KIH87589.1 hypothetical protein SPBR_05119 [Sporothrix brasiliensis 5110]
MTTLEGPYLPFDEYRRYRTTQDEQIAAEFRSVHERIDGVDSKLEAFKEETRAEFAALRQAAAEQQRLTARLRNQLLSNPTLAIEPIAIFDETRGVVQPDMNLFPRHAKEFYALRNPQDGRQHAKLSYLVSFYDVALPEAMGPSSSDEDSSGNEESQSSSEATGGGDDDDDNDVDNIFKDRNYLAVHMLETILGLSEDNFITFMERAEKRAARAAASAIKRAQDTLPLGAPTRTRPFVQASQPYLLATTSSQALRPQLIPPLTVSQIMDGYANEKSPNPDSQDGNRSNAKLSWRIGSPPGLQQTSEGAAGSRSSHGGGSQPSQLLSRPKQPSIPDGQKEGTPSEPGDSGSPTNPHSKTPSSSRYRKK